MQELIKIDGNKIEIAKETTKKIKKLLTAKIELEKIEASIREEMAVVMEENNIIGWEDDLMKISYNKAHKRKSVDTERLKADGIYEDYLKESDVKASVRITYK